MKDISSHNMGHVFLLLIFLPPIQQILLWGRYYTVTPSITNILHLFSVLSYNVKPGDQNHISLKLKLPWTWVAEWNKGHSAIASVISVVSLVVDVFGFIQ